MRLTPLTVAIKQVLKRPLFDEEKAIYEHKQLDFQKHVIRSARQLGRQAAYIRALQNHEERRRIICRTMGLSRWLLGEGNA